MNKIFRLVLVSVSLSDDDIAKVKTSWYWAEALCADTSDAVVTTSSSWFGWNVPALNEHVGAQRCAWGLFDCVRLGGRAVTFENYAGPMGWTYWGDYCN